MNNLNFGGKHLMLNPLSNFSGIISTWFALDLYTGASLKPPQYRCGNTLWWYWFCHLLREKLIGHCWWQQGDFDGVIRLWDVGCYEGLNWCEMSSDCSNETGIKECAVESNLHKTIITSGNHDKNRILTLTCFVCR